MSMLGVPYSPIVPSLTRWIDGSTSAMAYSRFSVPTTLFTWVYTACLRSTMEYGALRCSAKWTMASGRNRPTMSETNSASVRSPMKTSSRFPDTSSQRSTRRCSDAIGTRESTPISRS